MSVRRAIAGWVVAVLAGAVVTVAFAKVFLRAKPEAESIGAAWFAAPGAALALVPRGADLSFEGDALGGLDQTRHHGGTTALLIVGAIFILPVLITVDLLTLPVAAPCHRPFHCTTVVFHHCCR